MRLFIGGISKQTREENILQHFKKLGKSLRSCILFRGEQKAPSHRGFGFVTFKDQADGKEALRKELHLINGKFVQLKIADWLGKLSKLIPRSLNSQLLRSLKAKRSPIIYNHLCHPTFNHEGVL